MLIQTTAGDQPLRSPGTFKDLSALSINAITGVWTPAAGACLVLMGGCISSSVAGSVLFEDNAAGTTVVRTPKLLADTPYNFDLGQGIRLAKDHVLRATLAGAAITGFLYGIEVPNEFAG